MARSRDPGRGSSASRPPSWRQVNYSIRRVKVMNVQRIFVESRVFPPCRSYCVTEDGKVGRIGSYQWLAPARQKRGGYLAVSLYQNNRGKTWPVHQMVAIAFHGSRPSPRHDAAHNDGDKMNNHHSNIRWATRAENEHDKLAHGRSNRGARNGTAKLTAIQIKEIRI